MDDQIAGLIASSGLEGARLTDADPDPIHKDGVILTIAVHRWGRACHARDPQGKHALWLETTGGQTVGEIPGWAKPVQRISVRPDCFGFHEPDEICDGFRDPSTGKTEPPCAWRTRCRTFQRSAGPEEARILELREEMTDGDLDRLVRKVRPKTTQKHSALPAAERVAIGRSLLTEMVNKVVELGGWRIVPRQHRAADGDFFIQEANAAQVSSGAVNALVFQRRHGKPIPVVRVYLTESCRVEMNTQDESFVRSMLPDATIRTVKNGGRLMLSVSYLERENVEAFARCIHALAETGRLLHPRGGRW